jgi:hypothetical protein
MKPKLILYSLFTLVSLAGFRAHAQAPTYDLPMNIVLNTKDDYGKYEKDVIAAAKWLEEAPLDQDKEKRAQVNDFVMKWLMGSPNVSVAITPSVSALFEFNPVLMNIFMAGYTRYILETGSAATTFDATKAGLNSIVNVYSKGVSVSKDKSIEKLKAAQTSDTDFETYMMDKLKIARN